MMQEPQADGTVIRWLADDRYTYAAVKAGSSWYTTSVSRGGVVQSSVPQVVAWVHLLQVLRRPESSSVVIASQWTQLDIQPEGLDLI